VGITKLFHLNPDFENLRWVAGALSVGLASAFMAFTKTIHPPAGATALLAATTPEITALGWNLVPLILLGSVLLVAVGCITNNIQRQFPVYWWTAADLSRPNEDDIERQGKGDGKDVSAEESSYEKELEKARPNIMINDSHIVIPEWLSLDAEERSMLEVFRLKLKEGLSSTSSRDTDDTHVGETQVDDLDPS
jgi:HPP family